MNWRRRRSPYYRSSYVFVSRADRHLDIASIKDPRLRTLKIGVQLIGDDGFNTPPPHALAAQGIVDNLVGYTVYGDYRKANPPAAIVAAVERGDVDIAAVWGPLAGYFAKQSPVPLTVTPITDTRIVRATGLRVRHCHGRAQRRPRFARQIKRTHRAEPPADRGSAAKLWRAGGRIEPKRSARQCREAAKN